MAQKFIMNKVLLTLSLVLLLLPIRLLAQENFRIITRKKLDTFYGKQYYDGKRHVFVTDAYGKTKSIKTNNILSIRKEIKGWHYFEWEPTGLTDYLEISIDSMSREDLFLKAKAWIEKSFLPTEYGFVIQPDSVFAEYEGRSLYKNTSQPKGTVVVMDKLPSVIPPLDYRFNVDEDTYKITLVGCNHIVFQVPGSSASTFYTLNLTFYEGGYKIDPVNLFYCYIDPKFEEEEQFTLNPVDIVVGGILDGVLGNYDKTHIVEIPIYDITPYLDKSGQIALNLRCKFTRVEVLFNDLNRSLYNYIKGFKADPNIYVYYPEVGCWIYWRTW